MVCKKGTGLAMTSALFCDQCGAALPAQAVSCAVCRRYFGIASTTFTPSPSSPVQVGGASLSFSIAASADILRPGSLFVFRYRILAKVGEGGFGVIYKAQDLDQHNRLVAIKQINLSLLSPQKMIEATDSYNREVSYLSQLQHENIPRFYDYFTDPGNWYVVMDYIEGETLEDKLQKARHGCFSMQKVLDIGIVLCDVLGYLHAQHPPIIFRDVKPGNIMLTKTGRIYLIDFGIARHYTAGQRRDTAPLGSPGYAAPEQYGKAQTTAQTDIYGLGATLQTLLTGKEPMEFLVGSASLDHTIPEKMQTLLKKMLERDASQRPQSVDEVKQSLQWLREHSFSYKAQHTLAFTRDSLIPAIFQTLLFVALLLIIFFVIFATGFFNTLFWIPCILLMLCVIVGRSAYYLREEREDAATRLNAKEVLATVLKHLRGSILFALIPAIFFYALYDIQSPDGILINDVLLLSMSTFASIILSLYFLNREISWLWHLMTQWRRASKPVQVPPLQQRMHKHR